MKSVYLKNCLLLAGIVLLSFLVFLTSLTVVIRNQTIADKRAGLEANADAVVDMYNTFPVFDPNQPIYQETVKRLVSIVTLPANRMVLADENGIIVACSEHLHACPVLGGELSGELRAQLNTEASFSALTTIPDLLDGISYVFATRIVCDTYGTHAGYVLVASSADVVMREWGDMVSIFLLVAAFVVLLAILIAMLVARHQAAPLREMSAAANKFARGDYSTRVRDVGREDEIGELTAAFNAMAESIEQSENMRREFVGNVSHELKTPMTSITGFAEGILDGTIPPEKRQEYLGIVAAETKRLSRLVRRMLEVSRLQSMDIRELQKQSFDMTELLRRGVLGLESKITAKDLDVEMDLPEDPVMVLGDEDSIMQVTYNLLDNATKFSHPGTKIGISLVQQGVKAHITIKNTGDTISQEELPLIFNRFHKSDKSRSHDKEGVGLGLYIVKTIMNAHQEDIYIRSENGVTEVWFTLTLGPKKKK